MDLGPLSSQKGERSEEANRQAAGRCLEHPSLLDEVVVGLQSKNAALVGDCAEVLTMVAQQRPELVAPLAGALPPLLRHKVTRVRWEAAHALALVASLRPDVVEPILPVLGELLQTDSSVIVRDYTADMLGGYAGTSAEAAAQALPHLAAALTAQGGKQAGRALNGLARAVDANPGLLPDVHRLASPYLTADRPVVRKAAKALFVQKGRSV